MFAAKISYLAFLIILLTISGCNQNQTQAQTNSQPGNSGLSISNIDLAQENGSNAYNFSLYFQSVKSSTKLSDVCPASGDNCYCQFIWAATNPYDSSMQGALETVNTSLSIASSNSGTCSMPSYVYIPQNTNIQISVLSSQNNSLVGSYSFTKTPSIQAGNYEDSAGRPYINIIQYSCTPLSQPTDTTDAINLYIPESFLGDVVSSNNQFLCPDPALDLATGKKFSLSSTPYWLFPIQVSAGVILNVTSSSEEGVKYGSLGYAAAQNSDGTCPSFELGSGIMTPTYLLRKFDPVQQWKTSIYVLDQTGTNSTPPAGYIQDATFQACAPANV